ncbi:DEAD_2 domain-containing protein/Helicase_C_2 domain-containing protein [Cephalotus follicularis]|uniref:Regulator of telomere elongation helicase 1 homolog n=1 Tax=Cephalotus follicularis TaxID=3775 RepID=A0A1Q3BY40_CEPFO|nr:DEAD_2 domain-containing protein/Helicase_C_2 domain-containing protein [Cephalotus follicularis]
MPTYRIRGIDVDFPFEAYDSQLVYMEKVIQSLQNRCNALLESPTGTGKTLCLLCATLAWRKSLGAFSTGKLERNGQIAGSRSDMGLSQSQAKSNNLPTIIYTSRTHSQLRQVIHELKRSSYRPKMVILGSREQLCIHDNVSLLRGRAQTNACQSHCRKRDKKHQCVHFPLVSDYVKHNPHLGDEPIDIEDLVNIGRRSGPCPYYISRELHKVVDILFAPYNYLIDRGNRKSLTIDWDNSILIFDEAHNLESLCADAASFDLHSGILTACISEAKTCIDLSVARREEANDKSHNPDNFAILRALLLKLEKRIADVTIKTKELGFTQPGPYIYELLADLNITHETASKLIDTIEEAVVLLEEDKLQKSKGTVCRLESFSDILKIIFRDKGNAHAEYYRVHVQEVEKSAADVFTGKASRILSWWCFNPGVAMQEFSRMGVGSIILTSGTLSPMDSFAHELKLDFPVRLENPHVISSNQIWAGVVPAGPSSRSFNSSFRNRDSPEYKQELGNAIVNFARIVPDGLLVFFPSYYLLDQCIGCWKNSSHANSTTIWERICKHKKPVIEPRQSSLFSLSIEDYTAKLKDASTSGAVFFAVCRGKVSEGLDFADHAGRAVIITGLPFATLTDPKVRLKREYLDQQLPSKGEGSKFLTGEEWYNQQASRAVNQAVGRVIRHRHDYGAIIFCDERFAYANRQSQISRWIQPHIKCYSKFGDVVFSLTRFFRDGEVQGPTLPNTTQTKDRDMKLILNKEVKDAPLEDALFTVGSSTTAHDLRETKSAQPVDSHRQITLDQASSSKSLPSLLEVRRSSDLSQLSSLLEAKRSNNSSKVGEILPANRSSLTPYEEFQDLKSKSLSRLIYSEKKLLITARQNMQPRNHEMIDLTGDSLDDEKASKKELIRPCSAKKRKVLKKEHEAMQHLKNNQDLPLSNCSFSTTHENQQISDTKSTQDAQIGSAFLRTHDETMLKRDAESLNKDNCDVKISAVHSADEETRGSAFLIQVQEKLTAVDYKEFLGLLRALKSKAMDIGHVLKCIVRLFSGPERVPLLQRFKGYVPAKYHSLYEHYLRTNDETHKELCS